MEAAPQSCNHSQEQITSQRGHTCPWHTAHGSSDNDSMVWEKYYDAIQGQLKTEDLEAEYARLWGDSSPEVPTDLSSAKEVVFSREVKAQEKRGLEELLKDYQASKLLSQRKPRTSTVPTIQYERDPRVTAIARLRANYRCELSDCQNPTFSTSDGTPYCEVHHIEFLSTGGDDTPDNVACLCPAHHREAHLGQAAGTIRAELIEVRAPSKVHPVADQS